MLNRQDTSFYTGELRINSSRLNAAWRDYCERIGVNTLDQLLQSRQLSKGARGLSSSSLSV